MCISYYIFWSFLATAALSVHDEEINLQISEVPCTGSDNFKCNDAGTECIGKNLVCNGISECSTGQDESVLTCGCLDNEFQCNTSMCIDIIRRCDTHRDCDNGADEEDCKKYACPKTHSKCANYFCVPRDVICDFKDDCGDNSDEENCPKTECYESQFRCNNSQCVGIGFLCDGTPDCEDKSDEENCEMYPRCKNGVYMMKNKICDGWADCEDQSDETNCGECTKKEFKCQNGRCLKVSNVCDGMCDCGLTCEDENNCGSVTCAVGEKFPCKYLGQTFRCIDKKYVCDGSNDCWNNEDGSDESSCDDLTNCTEFRGHVVEMSSKFVCPEGKCLPAVGPGNAVCNHFYDCLNGEDEKGCEYIRCRESEYRCGNGQCIQMSKRCDGKFDCFDWSDESECENVPCEVHHQRCRSGQCVPEEKWCDYFIDCPDGSDERDCAYRHCLPSEFTCDNGQCIDSKYVCFVDADSDRKGCADMSHLYNCGHAVCAEDQFKCRNSYCIAESMRCDGNIDCPKSTYMDELGCPYECPYMTRECMCHSDELNCINKGLTELPGDIEYETRLFKFILGGNFMNVSLSAYTFNRFERILHLDLSNNSIEVIPAACFQNLYRLRTLNLENNLIKVLENGTFIGLSNLRSLYIAGNQISEIHPYAFMGLSQLQILDLSYQRLEELLSNSFIGMRNVYHLDLSNNKIQSIYDGAFNGLSALLTLRIDENDVLMIEGNVFHGLPVLDTLYTDEFPLCCLARAVKRCFPEPDEFSSCEDLMSNYLLRVSIWVLGITAFLGNMLVFGWRVRDNRNGKVHSFLITNLAIGDFFMGVYLLIIAFVDTHYRGKYFISEKYWRGSDLCKFAGFISTFSSELSVFTLTIITLDRLICIIFPLKLKRLGIKEACIVMPCIWTLVIILSGVPLFGIDYFENFYGRSGVCLAFHITPEKPKGWEYSVFVFLVLNLVSFLVIFISYLWMFMVAKKTTTAVRKSKAKSDKSMAKRMTVIVMTDFCCWVPIIILGFASLGGVSVPPQVYAWVAVFVLPLNSAMNPILYTISTAPFMRNIRKRASRFRKSFTGSIRTNDTKHSYIDGSSQSWTRNSMYRQLELTRLRGLKKTYSAHNNHHNEKSSRIYRHGSQAV